MSLIGSAQGQEMHCHRQMMHLTRIRLWVQSGQKIAKYILQEPCSMVKLWLVIFTQHLALHYLIFHIEYLHP
jgi:hypothetical protein